MNDKILDVNECCSSIDVHSSVGLKPRRDDYIREFNKGKSFSYSKWLPLTKYTNDPIKQDFTSYNGALLACIRTHVSQDPPELVYDEETGMVIGVNSEDWEFVFATGINENKYYLSDGQEFGLPIFTKKMLDSLSPDMYPEKYIQVRDPEEDIAGEDKNGDTYLNILFSSIRKLQAEVAKLRNSFKYGITSYTGTDTAMSDNLNNLTIEDEPL